MPTDKPKRLTKSQKNQIYAFARTLYEVADDIQQLCRAKSPEHHNAIWILKQTHNKLHEILKFFGEEL